MNLASTDDSVVDVTGASTVSSGAATVASTAAATGSSTSAVTTAEIELFAMQRSRQSVIFQFMHRNFPSGKEESSLTLVLPHQLHIAGASTDAATTVDMTSVGQTIKQPLNEAKRANNP